MRWFINEDRVFHCILVLALIRRSTISTILRHVVWIIHWKCSVRKCGRLGGCRLIICKFSISNKSSFDLLIAHISMLSSREPHEIQLRLQFVYDSTRAGLLDLVFPPFHAPHHFKTLFHEKENFCVCGDEEAKHVGLYAPITVNI